MHTTRMTSPMRRSLESRLADLNSRIETLDAQREGDDSLEATALLEQLRRERSDVSDALRDAILIDDEPFDTQAIETGDTVTLRDDDGGIDRYVLVDGNLRSRARSDWVSVSSPLGAVLVGRSTGDRVYAESPAGPLAYEIVAFERRSEGSVAVGAADPSQPATLLPSEAFLG